MMKEVIVHPIPDITTEIVDSPVPIPVEDDIVIKVAVTSSNAKGLSC
jgi:NADPH2:quinone reductase